MGTADNEKVPRSLRLPPVGGSEHKPQIKVTEVASQSSGSLAAGTPIESPEDPHCKGSKGAPLQSPVKGTEPGQVLRSILLRKKRGQVANEKLPSPRRCLYKRWVPLSPRDKDGNSGELLPQKVGQNVQFKGAVTKQPERDRPRPNGSKEGSIDEDRSSFLRDVRNRRSTGFVSDLDLTALFTNTPAKTKGTSSKKAKAYSSRSARGPRGSEEAHLDEGASSMHRLFVTERICETEVTEDLVDFFGMHFLDQDSRFPVWLQKRQDFQSVCPRFCETDEHFLQIKNQIPEELLLRKAFKMSPLLSSLHPIMMSKLIKRCEFENLSAHTTVVEQGDVADKIFVVLEGTLDVINKPKYGDKVQEGVLTEGLIFGDVGYETQSKRLSTVTTRTACRLAIMDVKIYREVVHVERERQVRQLVEWISEEVPWAASLSKRKVTMLAHLVTPRKLRPGEYVYHEGDSAENIYIVKTGRCVAVKIFAYKQEHRWPTGSKGWDSHGIKYNREALLREYREGDVFGEEPFADENCRRWGVKAVDTSPVEAEAGSRSQEVELLQIDAAACQKEGGAILTERMCSMIKAKWQQESQEEVRKTAEEQDCFMIRDFVKTHTILKESPQRYLDRRHTSQETTGSFEAATDPNHVRVGSDAANLV